MTKRINVQTATGDNLSVRIAYSSNGYTFPYTAAIDEHSANGKTPREAVENLLEQMGIDAHPNEIAHLNVFFPQSLPMLLRRQAG